MRALLIALAAFGCGVPAHGPTMEAGRDCFECHNRGGADPSFTAAGTLFMNATDAAGAGVKGARIRLIDANGRAVTLKSNQSGNFYTREPIAFPLQVAIVEAGGIAGIMSEPVPEGGCNACHDLPPPSSQLPTTAPGRVAVFGGGGDEFMLPGFDCQSCHQPAGSAHVHVWTASGTVFVLAGGGAGDEGVTVTIVDARGRTFERVTNRAGNFFLPEDIAFGDAARVVVSKGGVTRRMTELRRGSCNGCHRSGGEGEHYVSLRGGD
jgi:hypothetical protein